MSSEWVVASCRLCANGRHCLCRSCPWVVRAWSRGLLLLDRLLLLLLLLAESVHLLSPRGVRVLRLQRLLLESGLLRLLLLVSISTVSVLESSLLRLHASRLVVGIVQEARLLRLLLLLLHRVAEPIHRSLLLVTLVESSRLRGLRWRVVKEQTGLVLVIQFSLAQFFLFSAELQCLGEIVIGLLRRALRFSLRCLVGLVLACFERQSELEIVVLVLVCTMALSVFSRHCRLALVSAHGSHILETGDAGLPRATVCAFGAKALLVHDK